MCLGTISYESKIYNLDYMTSEELKILLNSVFKTNELITIDKIELEGILSSVYTNRITEESINTKIGNQLSSINVSIDRINPKFIDNSKNYEKIKNEIIKVLSEYEIVLKQYSQKYDKKIEDLIFEKIDVENKLFQEIISEDNVSDDDNLKKMQKEIKLLNRKIINFNEKKKNKIFESMEAGGKTISTQIRKPKTFSKITKFFVNRFNTYNVIIKNVIEPLKLRIDDFKINELKKSNIKISEFNLDRIQQKIENIKNKK